LQPPVGGGAALLLELTTRSDAPRFTPGSGEARRLSTDLWRETSLPGFLCQARGITPHTFRIVVICDLP